MPREVEAKVSSEFTLVDALMEMEENLNAGHFSHPTARAMGQIVMRLPPF